MYFLLKAFLFTIFTTPESVQKIAQKQERVFHSLSSLDRQMVLSEDNHFQSGLVFVGTLCTLIYCIFKIKYLSTPKSKDSSPKREPLLLD